MTINHCLIHGDTLVEGVCAKCEFSTEPALMRLTEDLSKAEAKNRSLQSKIDQIKADGCNGAAAGSQASETEKLLTAERLLNTDLEVKLETEQRTVRDLTKQLKKIEKAATVDKCLDCSGGMCSGCKHRDGLIDEVQKELIEEKQRFDIVWAEKSDKKVDLTKEPELTLEPETEAPKAPRGRPRKDK